MNRQKIILYATLVTIFFLFSACGNSNKVKSPYKEKKKFSSVKIADIPHEKLGTHFKLKKVDEIVLKSGTSIIGDILVIKLKDNKILVSDPLHSRQCYLFREDGTLLKKVGRYGEGPAEYQIVLAACFSGDRIFLVENRKVNIYTNGGEFINTLRKPIRGICNGAYEGPNGSFYAVSTNRYNKNKDTIYHLDKDGNLLKTFSELENVPVVFDTFHPQTGLLTDNATNKVFQYFNYTNQLSVFDIDGNKIKTIKMETPFYTAPDFSKSKVEGHKAEKEYRASFTQITNMFKYSDGYVIFYRNWKTIKEGQQLLEFRDFDFKRTGYAFSKTDEKFLTIHNDHLISSKFTESETKLVFMSFVPSD